MTPKQLADLRTKIENINQVIRTQDNISPRYLRQPANELSNLLDIIDDGTAIENTLLADVRNFIEHIRSSTRSINQEINPNTGINIIQRIDNLVNINKDQIELAYNRIKSFNSYYTLISLLQEKHVGKQCARFEVKSFINRIYNHDIREGYYYSWQLDVINTVNNELINRLERPSLSLSSFSSLSLGPIIEEEEEEQEDNKQEDEESIQEGNQNYISNSNDTIVSYFTNVIFDNQEVNRDIFYFSQNYKQNFKVDDEMIYDLTNEIMAQLSASDKSNETPSIVAATITLSPLNLEGSINALGIIYDWLVRDLDLSYYSQQ